jgi:MoaA/NifB/PqqE/SkfB family radical SAM enzyme
MLPIKKAVIEICGACNYSCKMCPHSFDGGRESSFRRMMNYEMFVDALDQLLDSEVKEIYLEGSGEPSMNRKLPQFVRAGTDRGFKMSFITNGFWFKDELMKATVDAGLHFARFSVTGYNPAKYNEWMKLEDQVKLYNNKKNVPEERFYTVRRHAEEAIRYIESVGSKATIGSYHLIIDNNQVKYEIDQYRKNWIDHVPGIKSSIWKMHNWSGVYDEVTWRAEKKNKRSCGRPFSPDLIVRAGGNDGKTGAVVPCCMVLGQDSKAVLGHLSENSIEEIWYGEAYEHLRKMHREHRFDEIDYCKNCDMLYDTPEALVWSNFDANYNILTGGDFDMREFRK